MLSCILGLVVHCTIWMIMMKMKVMGTAMTFCPLAQSHPYLLQASHHRSKCGHLFRRTVLSCLQTAPLQSLG
ncbi:hypothetical protein BJ742DRAFT_811187 [Cladochytrium replicatum]|nr:hypothetical protein BJ742DRAFT_811187 [Cladochytrium replicatum]